MRRLLRVLRHAAPDIEHEAQVVAAGGEVRLAARQEERHRAPGVLLHAVAVQVHHLEPIAALGDPLVAHRLVVPGGLFVVQLHQPP